MADLNTEEYKSKIVTNVYHITSESNVALHKHPKHDEIFYCVKGTGFGVLEDKEVELIVGRDFLVHAGMMHSLKTSSDLFVASFLIPKIEQ
ncbi:MAG: cupin domain-containing protein [Ignavibacteriales bacterium]|nr:cupin domain-containing protein [Ignavibacteriales bacterium]